MKVRIKTLGCKVNYVESLALEELLSQNGYEISEDEVCDIFILNSCSVTNESDKKSRQALSRNRKINPDNYAIIMGCYSQVSTEELVRNKNVNLVCGNMDKMDIVNHLGEKYRNKSLVKDISRFRTFEQLPIHGRGEKTRGFIKVQDGCDNFCSYCIIPYARGRVRSRSLKSIAAEAESLSNEGVKEIVITGIEVASYGKDLDGPKLIDAIEMVAKSAPNSRIRLSSLEISIIDDEFLNRLSQINNFCNHFHLSLQSGSDSVLKNMNRKYNTEIFEQKCNLIRKYFSDVGITTDIIVGFPGETDENFKETCEYVQKLALSRIHVFPYSIRKGTKAAEMIQVDNHIKNSRAKILREIADDLEIRFRNSLLNKVQECLIEEKVKGYYYGYTNNYVRVSIKDDNNKIENNSIISVKLIKNSEEEYKWSACFVK